MDAPNPYEAPAHPIPAYPAPRRTRSRLAGSVGLGFTLLGFAGGAVFGSWASDPRERAGGGRLHGLPADGVIFVSGLLGAVASGVIGHFIGHAIQEPAPPPDRIESASEARRQDLHARVGVTDQLIARAELDGDHEVRARLARYRAALERELRS